MKEMKKDYTCKSLGGTRLLPNFKLRNWLFAAVLMLCVNSMNMYSAPLVKTTETLTLWDVTTQADDLVACYSSGKLSFKLAPLVDATTATFILPLADGVMYVPGSLDDNYMLTNGDVTVADIVEELDITDLSRPVFQLTNSVQPGDEIYFSIQRSVDCPSIISGLADSIIITNNDNTDILLSNNYSITSPEVVLTHDVTKFTDVFVGGEYKRVIYFKNGSDNSPADHIYLELVYGSGVRLDSFIMNDEILSPADMFLNIDGTTTYRLTMSGDLLGDDGILTKDEELNFTEHTTVSNSNPADVLYTVGWGKSPDALCGSETKRGEYSMQDGGALLDGSYGTLSDFSSWCDTLTLQMYYSNTGSAELTNILSSETNNSPSYVMYDVELVLGSMTDGTLDYYNAMLDDLIDYSHFTIGGHSIAKDMYTPVEGYGGYRFDLKDLFTTDPDGIGTGLEDIDGDGYFDDLANGDAVCLDFKGMIKKSVNNISTACLSLHPRIIFSEYDNVDRESQLEYIEFISGFPYTYVGDGSDVSFIPANIDKTPFEIELNYPISSITSSSLYLTDKGRYSYELTLPEGYTIVGDVVSFTTGNRVSPTSEDLVPYIATANTDGTTTILAYSTSNESGFMTLTVQGCSESTLNPDFAYKVALSADPLSECNPTITLVDAFLSSRSTCASPSDLLGFDLIEAPLVRRTDGSLGWTDESLTQRQSAENISDYDLSVGLYLDTLAIYARGIQHDDAVGSSLRLIVDDLNLLEGPLKPLSLDIIVKRGNDTIYNAPIDDSYVDSYTKNGSQYMDWDLTSAVSPSITIERADSVFAVSYYEVSSPVLSATSDNCGEEIYFYNTFDGAYGDSLVAGLLFIPEMRLITIGGFTGTNTNFTDGCLSASHLYAMSGNLYDQMFYVNEIRPTYLVTSLEMLMEETVDLVDMYIKNYGASSSLIDYTNIYDDLAYENNQTQDGVSGLQKITYTNRNFDGSALDLSMVNSDVVMKPLIQVDNSDYSLMHWYSIRNTCQVDELTKNQLIVKGIPYYYHNAGKDMNPQILSELSRVNDFSSEVIYENDIINDGIPEIQIINLSGDIHATKPVEGIQLRLTAFNNDAPYTWLSFPTQEEKGLNVEYVIGSASGDTIYANPLTGIFELNADGISQNTSTIYNVYVSYTSCDITQLDVYGGWNCSEFPTDIDNNCGTIMTQVEIKPSPSAIELIYTTNHDKVNDFGDKLVYSCFVNNKGAGYTVNNMLTLNTPIGFDIDSLLVEYPRNSGQWQTLTNIGDLTSVYDVSEHDNYPTIGIPGVTDALDVDDRAYNIEYYVSIECGFNSGLAHRITADADRLCGGTATGSGEVLISNALDVESVIDLGYNVSMIPFTNDLTLMCGQEGTTAVSGVLHFTSASDSAIATDGYLEVQFPSGYSYANSSLILSRPNENHDGYDIVSSSRDAVTEVNINGFNIAKLYYPTGIYKSDSIYFEFQLEDDASQNASCGKYSLQISANEVTNSPSNCPFDPVGSRAQEFISVTINDDVAPIIDCSVAGFVDLYLDQVAGSEEAIENWLAEMTGLLADNTIDNCTNEFTADQHVSHNYTTTSYTPECGDFDSATGFEVLFNVEDNCGNVATSCSRTIKVIYATPVLNPSDDEDLYVHYGETVELNVDATNADALSLQWEINTTGTWVDFEDNQSNTISTRVSNLDSILYRLKMTPVGSTCTTYSKLFTVYQDFSVSYEDGVEDEIITVPATEYYLSTNEVIAKPAISRTGYVFTGWLDVENNTLLPAGTSFTMPRANVVLVAQWTPVIVYNVEYYTQDAADPTSYTLYEQQSGNGIKGDSVFANIHTYVGYVRYAAHSNDLAEGVLTADGSLTLRLYYNLTRHTVSYEELGGLEVNDTTGVLYGTTVTVPTATRARYTFEGWYLNADGTGVEFTDASIVTSDTIVYAQWSVTPLVNGNERDTTYEDMPLTTVNVLDNNIAEDDVLTLRDPAVLNGGTIVYNSADGNFEYTPVANFYGNDTITYQVCNVEGSCVIDTLFITVLSVNDAPFAINDTAFTSRAKAITFSIIENDWDDDGILDPLSIDLNPDLDEHQNELSLDDGDFALDSLGNITFTPNDNFVGSVKVISYDICDDKGQVSNVVTISVFVSDSAHHVTYDSQGGTDVSVDTTGYFEFDTVIISDETPEKEHYDFDGWLYNDTIYYEGGQLTMPYGDVTLEAQWSPIAYNVFYDANNINNEGAPEPASYIGGALVSVSTDTPDKPSDAYRFIGWAYNDSTYNGDDTFDMPFEDITLVARWLFGPEIFTPNGDGIHDLFELPWNDLYSKVEVKIFNRWGDLVYKHGNYDNTWDGVCTEGISSGDKVPTGTYFYVVTLDGDSVPEGPLQGYVYIISDDQ